MKRQIGIILACVLIGGHGYGCTSPPGKGIATVKAKQSQVAVVSLMPVEQPLQPVAIPSLEAVTTYVAPSGEVKCVYCIPIICTGQKVSMTAVGHAIDRRVDGRNAAINLLVIAFAGHQLINLHIDPGLTV